MKANITSNSTTVQSVTLEWDEEGVITRYVIGPSQAHVTSVAPDGTVVESEEMSAEDAREQIWNIVRDEVVEAMRSRWLWDALAAKAAN